MCCLVRWSVSCVSAFAVAPGEHGHVRKDSSAFLEHVRDLETCRGRLNLTGGSPRNNHVYRACTRRYGRTTWTKGG